MNQQPVRRGCQQNVGNWGSPFLALNSGWTLKIFDFPSWQVAEHLRIFCFRVGA